MSCFDRAQVVRFLLFVSCCFFIGTVVSGCTFTPEMDQFVTAGFEQEQDRSNGSCQEPSLFAAESNAASAQAMLNPDHIALLDWNIYKEQRTGWEKDFIRLSRAKDILVLQEILLTGRFQQILLREKFYWNFISAFKYKGVETGVLVASRIEALASCGIRHNEPIIVIPKTIIVSKFAIAGSQEQLLVANVHGINITLGVEAYQKQFDKLQAVLEKHNGPLILVGDFNNWNDRRTAVVDLLAEKLSLRVLAFGDEGRTRFFGEPVDHILFRGLSPVSHTVHNVTSSDHNPISVTFRLASGSR